MRINFLFAAFILFSSCAMTPVKKGKINGLSFVASRDTISEQHTAPVVHVSANYAAIMPFGFIRDLNEPEIIYNTERQWFGETLEGARQYIKELRKKNIKIMLKPQIWVWKGEFTGYIEMKNEEHWNILENSYLNFILDFARLAEEQQVELFCIGTELEKFVENRPDYWHQLIEQIRLVYKGQLTYAANWDEFKRTPFWNALDYIGIDAYFPVSDMQTPTIDSCRKGWKEHKTLIKSNSEKYNKPILFTEFGYRSTDYTGRKPWESDHSIKSLNLQGQSNATQALFEEFWKEKWFAGGFIWKWFHKHDEVGGKDNNQFTPQNKPAEDILKTFYSKR